jgi:hypothetical protein
MGINSVVVIRYMVIVTMLVALLLTVEWQRFDVGGNRNLGHIPGNVSQVSNECFFKIPAVNEYDICFRNKGQVTGCRLVTVGVLAGSHQDGQVDSLSADLGNDVADDAGGGDDAEPAACKWDGIRFGKQ